MAFYFFAGDYVNILLLGGDDRQTHLKVELEKKGHIVKHIFSASDYFENFDNYEIIILPFPTTRDGFTLNNSFCDEKWYLSEIEEKISDQSVLCGNYNFMNKNSIDYGKSESLAIMNAVLTAEGAIEVAIRNTDITLFGSNCLVVGYGRIGKILADRLKSLGSNVTVSARKTSDLAFIKAFCYNAVNTYSIAETAEKYDIIINTVEHPVITAEVLKKCKKDCLLIELASAPFGIDFSSADKLGLKTIKAQGLPGKTSSRTAAKILSETILKII